MLFIRGEFFMRFFVYQKEDSQIAKIKQERTRLFEIEKEKPAVTEISTGPTCLH